MLGLVAFSGEPSFPLGLKISCLFAFSESPSFELGLKML
jgi:hypothetical protein